MKSTITFFFLLGAFGLFAQTFSWTEQQSGVTTQLRDVYFSGDLDGWAVGIDGVILHTSDGGDTWESQTSGTTERLDAVHFIDPSTGWAVGSQNTALVLKTTDGGDTWNELPNNFQTIQIRDVFFVDANTGWVMFREDIHRSTDGGVTWILEEYASSVTALNNKGIFATSDSIAFVCGKRDTPNNMTDATVFNRRPENSNLWGTNSSNDFALDDELYSISFASDSVGFVGGLSGKVYRMQSDGIFFSGPWELNYDLNLPGITIINSISFPTSNTGMFNHGTTVNSINYGIVHHTSDGGDTWTATPDSIPNLLSSILHSPSPDFAYAVGSGGKIFKGERIIVSTNEYENLVGFEVFPNPFEDKFTLSIILGQAENIVLKLSNINGQMIFENHYNLTQGGNNIEIDQLEESGSGIYFLNLYSDKGEFITTQKVVKF